MINPKHILDCKLFILQNSKIFKAVASFMWKWGPSKVNHVFTQIRMYSLFEFLSPLSGWGKSSGYIAVVQNGQGYTIQKRAKLYLTLGLSNISSNIRFVTFVPYNA